MKKYLKFGIYNINKKRKEWVAWSTRAPNADGAGVYTGPDRPTKATRNLIDNETSRYISNPYQNSIQTKLLSLTFFFPQHSTTPLAASLNSLLMNYTRSPKRG